MHTDKIGIHEPTRHPQNDELIIGSIIFNAHDLGGHAAARRLWKTYFANVNAIIFLVDSTDVARLPEARDELNKLLITEELKGIPFLILGNKIDSSAAISLERLKYELGLDIHTTGKINQKQIQSNQQNQQPLEIFMCSVVKRAGYSEGFKWLSQFI